MKARLAKVREWLASSRAEAIIKFLVIASVLLNLYFGQRVVLTQSCLQNYIVAQKASDAIAGQAATEDRKVVDDMVLAVTHAQTREDTRRALDIYIETRARNDKTRAANPPAPFHC
jgi:hypothetical protein